VLGAIPAERADQQVLLQRLHLRFREALYRVLLKRLLRDVLGELHESAAALECTKPAAEAFRFHSLPSSRHALTLYTTFPDLAGVPPERLPETRTPPEVLQAHGYESTANEIRTLLRLAAKLSATLDTGAGNHV
jgi:hypothetical protein